MKKRMSRDRAGVATIIILLIVVVIIAGAGVAVYVAVSGSDDNSNNDDSTPNTPTVSGPGIGSAFVYKTADGKSSLTTELLGETAKEYIYGIKGLAFDGSTSLLAVNKSDGKVSDTNPIRTAGSGDNKVRTWTVEFGEESADISTKKVNGAYNISEIKINSDVTYTIRTEDSTVKEPSDKAPSSNIGESFEYTVVLYMNLGRMFDKELIIDGNGTITSTRLADTADGKYIFSVVTDIKYRERGSSSGSTPGYPDEHTVEYYISSDIDNEMISFDGVDWESWEDWGDLSSFEKESKTIDGLGSPVNVYEYKRTLRQEDYGVVSYTTVTIDIGISDDVLYSYSIYNTAGILSLNLKVTYAKHTT
jgi:hypothetical protein